MGRISRERAAQVAPRGEDTWPGGIRRGYVPHHEQRAAAEVLPPQHDVAAQRLDVEVRIASQAGWLELERARTGEPLDVAVGADGDEGLREELHREIAVRGEGRSHRDVDDVPAQV